MAQTKKTVTKKTTKTRARTDTGAFIADDPNTPENEAWVETKPAKVEKAPAKDAVVWFESREKEPSMFAVAGIGPIRNFQSGRLEYEVQADDVERFEKNHFVMNARIFRKR